MSNIKLFCVLTVLFLFISLKSYGDDFRFTLRITNSEPCSESFMQWEFRTTGIYVDMNYPEEFFIMVEYIDKKEFFNKSIKLLSKIENLNLGGEYGCPHRSSLKGSTLYEVSVKINNANLIFFRITECEIKEVKELILYFNSFLEGYENIPIIPTDYLYDCECKEFKWIKRYFD